MENELISTEKLEQLIIERKVKEIRNIFEVVPTIDIAEACDDFEDISHLVFIFKFVKSEYTADLFTELSNDTKFDINILHESYLNYPNGVKSKKPYSTFKTYAANSYQGTTRTYNEDRIVIIPNMKKPKSFVGKTWPKVSFFGLYDGHGGERCADFLKDHLHSFIINDSNFPIDVKEAIKNGFERAEKDFLSIAVDPTNKNVLNDDSGSCACVIIIVDKTICSANS